MATEADRFRLGLFILLTLAVLGTAVVILGSGRLFARWIPVVTYFDESVQGLEIGSPVKKRGVQVGRVTRVSTAPGRRLVRVNLELNPESCAPTAGEPTPARAQRAQQARTALAEMVDQGLRARLELSGITGLRFVDLDYYPEALPICPTGPGAAADEVVIPSTTSTLRQLETSVMLAATRIAEVDFAGIAKRVGELLQNVNRFVNEPRIQQALDDLQKSAASLRHMTAAAEPMFDEAMTQQVRQIRGDLATVSTDLKSLTAKAGRILDEESYRRMTADLGAAAAKARTTMEKVEQRVDAVDAQGTVDEARGTLREVAQAAAVVTELRADLKRSIHDFDMAVQAIRDLAQFLQQNPSSVVRGRPLGAEGK